MLIARSSWPDEWEEILRAADELRTSEPGQLPALSSSRMEAEKNCKSRARVGQSVSADGGR